MIRRLSIVLAGLALALSLATTPASATVEHQASVHAVTTVAHPGPGTVYDDMAAITCAGTRTQTQTQYNYHFGSAQPTYMDANHVRYSCTMHSTEVGLVCHWTAIKWAGGPITGPYDETCALL